jgi:DNA-binding response OmpR family regulator
MTIQHYTAAEYIISQSNRIEQLVAETQALRQRNATLTAINIKLQSTDLSAADIAESLRLGCPQWREVAAILAPPCQCGVAELPPALEAMKNRLTETENKILRYLYRHLDKTIATEAVIHAAGIGCADNMDAARKSLNVHINRLRNKLKVRSLPFWVYTVRNAGYRLEQVTSD